GDCVPDALGRAGVRVRGPEVHIADAAVVGVSVPHFLAGWEPYHGEDLRIGEFRLDLANAVTVWLRVHDVGNASWRPCVGRRGGNDRAHHHSTRRGECDDATNPHASSLT